MRQTLFISNYRRRYHFGMIQKQERGPHGLSRGNLCNGVTCCNLCYKLLRSFFLPSPYSISLSYNLSRADSPANSRTQARATLWKALDVSKWSVYLRENIPLGGSDVRKETQESRIHVWPSLWTSLPSLMLFLASYSLFVPTSIETVQRPSA